MPKRFSKTSIFLSYSRQYQKETVQQLAHYLSYLKQNQWNMLTEGENGTADKVITMADVVVICYSNQYADDKVKEADFADRCQKPVLVVNLHENTIAEGLLGVVLSNAQDTMNWFDCDTLSHAAEEVARRVSQLISANKFRLFSLPELPNWICSRPNVLESVFFEKLQSLRPGKNGDVLLISGVGKTTLISSFLRNDNNRETSLPQNCHIKAVHWINSCKWQNMTVFQQYATSTLTLKTIILRELKGRQTLSKSDLLIFDDVDNPVLVEAIYNYARKERLGICILTTDSVASEIIAKRHQNELHYFQIPAFSDQEITGVIQNVLHFQGADRKAVISQPVMHVLAVSCSGSPKTAVDLGRLIAENVHQQSDEEQMKNVFFSLVLRQSQREKGSVAKVSTTCLPEIQQQLICRDVPNFERYHQRKDEELKLIEGIRRLTTSHSYKGAMVVNGPSGVGKTSLISSILRNAEYNDIFVQDCGIHIVIWLNCGLMADTSKVSNALLKTGRELMPPNEAESCLNLAKMVKYFVNKRPKQRILFILDDISSDLTKLQDLLDNSVGYFVAIAASDCRDSNLQSLEINPMSNDQIVEMLLTTFGLKDKLSESQLSELASRICHGLPLLASLTAGLFYRSRNCQRKFAEIMRKPLFQKDDLPSQLFRQSFAMLYPHLTKAFFALLLFEADQPIPINDLAALWFTTLARANEDVEIFEELSLLRRASENCWHLHRLFYNNLINLASENYHTSSFDNLRLEIVKNMLPGCDLFNSICTLVEKDNFDLVCLIIQKLPIISANYNQDTPTLPVRKLEDSRGRTALMAAAKCGHVTLVKALCMKCPIMISMQDDKDQTAFVWAVLHGQLEAAETLYDSYPEVISLHDSTDRRIFDLAIETKQNVKIIEFLLKKRPEFLKVLDNKKRTVLMLAAKFGKGDVVELLYNRWQESVKMADKDGNVAVMYAVEGGHLEATKFLCKTWPECIKHLNLDGEGILTIANRCGNTEVARFIHDVWRNGDVEQDWSYNRQGKWT